MRPFKTLALLTFAIVSVLAIAVPGAALGTVEETVLCQVAPTEANVCDGEAHVAETPISASSTVLFTVKEVAFGVDGEVACESELEGTTTAALGEPLLAAEITAMSFTECIDNLSRECTVTVLDLPYEASLLAGEGTPGDGRIFIHESTSEGEPGVTAVCEDANPFTPDVNCTYEVEETDAEVEGGAVDLAELEFEGGAEPELVAGDVELEEAGGAKCPGSEPQLDATYEVQGPAPSFLAGGNYGVDVDPGILNFTGVNDEQSTTVTNTGSTTWKITSIFAAGTDFDVTDNNKCKNRTLLKTEKCKVTVKCLTAMANGEMTIGASFLTAAGGLKVLLRC